MIQFFHEHGTTIESFLKYFKKLYKHLRRKYPRKELLFVLDNLHAHKSVYIMRKMKHKHLSMLLVPSNTPEFNPVE